MIDLRALFVLFLLIGVNFLDELYSCRIKDVLRNNMLVKHIVAFLTLHIFVTLTSKDNGDNFTGDWKKSVIVYLMFLISTRVRHEFFWIFVIGLLIYYVGSLYVERYTDDLKKPGKYTDLERRDIDRRLKVYIEYLDYIFRFLIAILGVGFLIYLGEKRNEMGERFDFATFVMGDRDCMVGGGTLAEDIVKSVEPLLSESIKDYDGELM